MIFCAVYEKTNVIFKFLMSELLIQENKINKEIILENFFKTP